jgi:hypothetical protein
MKTNPETAFPRKLYLENLVFVDGFGRSGKFMAAPIVASLERVEHLQLSWLLEYIPVMHQMGHISQDAAAALLQAEVENGLYYTLIGRDANFRFSDITGIWNAKDPSVYLKRIHAEEGDAVLETLKKDPPILLYLTHDALCHGDMFFAALPALKIVHIERHPIDVLASWHRKRTAQMADNLRNQTLLIRGQRMNMPWYVAGWEAQYEKLSQIDRLILSFQALYEKRRVCLANMGKDFRKRVCVVRFEGFTSDPGPVVDKICRLLGTRPTTHTPRILVRERCPRTLVEQERQTKLDDIQAKASPEILDILNHICDEYEKTDLNSEYALYAD